MPEGNGKNGWVDLSSHADIGIETVRAHFKGPAYDPHWHDEYLIGVTEKGVQQFSCRKENHFSTPGRVFMVEPGEIHDGYAPSEEGFTYIMLYMQPQWVERAVLTVFEQAPINSVLSFKNTLETNPSLALCITKVFNASRYSDLKIVQQTHVDNMINAMTRHLKWRSLYSPNPKDPSVAERAREFIHSNVHMNIGLDDLAQAACADRFRMTRAFKEAYGLPPHAYLVQLRLAKARQLLARGIQISEVAADLGFSDQSHLGRWFRRAYGLTPASYRAAAAKN